MGQDAIRRDFDRQQFRWPLATASWRSTGALKRFSVPQASQAIEKVDSERENPSKSKFKKPSSKAHFATEARLAVAIQPTRCSMKRRRRSDDGACNRRLAGQDFAGAGGAANFSRLAPCNPLKTNDRRRFTAENGGKRRRSSVGIRAFPARRGTRGCRSRGAQAPAAGYSIQRPTSGLSPPTPQRRAGKRSLKSSNSARAAWISPPAGPCARAFGFQA
jgi:hypothetical protein